MNMNLEHFLCIFKMMEIVSFLHLRREVNNFLLTLESKLMTEKVCIPSMTNLMNQRVLLKSFTKICVRCDRSRDISKTGVSTKAQLSLLESSQKPQT